MRSKVVVAGTLAIFITGIGCSRSPQHYIERGNAFFLEHKLEDAAIQYKKAIQKDPNSGEALYRLGLVSLEQNAFVEAYPLLTRAVEAVPQNYEAKAKLAETCMAIYVADPRHPRVMYEQAEKISEQLSAKNPNSFDGLRMTGTLRFFDQKPKQAIELFEKANQIQPMQHDLVVSWAQALFQDNRFQEGERLALELIKKEPAFGPIYDILYRQYVEAKRMPDAEQILKSKVSSNPTKVDYVVELAEHYVRAQKPIEMGETLQRMVDDSKNFPEGPLKAGDFYVKVGNGTEAIRQFEEGARKNPKDKLVYQKRVVDVLLLQAKRDDASKLVDSILKDTPKDPDARRVRATLRMESVKPEDLNAAIEEFTALVKDVPNDPVLRFNFGRAWQAKRDLGHAQTEFQEALRVRNDYVPALNALVVISLQQQKPGDAIRYIQDLLAYEPKNTGAKLMGVSALTALGRYGEAHTELNSLMADSPNSLGVQLQAGFLAIAEKKYKDAENLFQKIYKAAGGGPGPAAGLAELYSAQQQYGKAIQVLSADLKKSPESSSLLSLLAYTAGRSGNYDQAIAAYQQLLSQEPTSAELYVRLGLIYQSKGDHDSAIKALQRAKQLAPSDPTATLLLGISLDAVHRTDEAKANYERALHLQPDNPAALNNLAYLLAANGGNLDDAAKLIDRALQRSPGQPDLTDTLGYVYLKKKQNESAVRTFNSLVRQNPSSAVYHYHLGMALLESGDKVKAKSEFENALANQPSQEDAAKLKELLGNMRG